MTNQTPKQEVEWWDKKPYRILTLGEEPYIYNIPAILAEHRKMVVEECLTIIDGEKWSEEGLLKSPTIQEEGLRLHRNQVCDDLTYAVSALLNTKDEV